MNARFPTAQRHQQHLALRALVTAWQADGNSITRVPARARRWSEYSLYRLVRGLTPDEAESIVDRTAPDAPNPCEPSIMDATTGVAR